MGEPCTKSPPAAEPASRPIAARELARITMQEHDSVPVAAIAGEIDVSNVDKLAESLTSISNLAPGLVVDLRRVDYLDSAAISLLHDLAMRLRQRSQRLIVVCPPDSPPRQVLELTALTAHTLVLDELAPAIDAMRAAPDD
jgi:anti-anti-sigma factor